jgi:hypothetical protein
MASNATIVVNDGVPAAHTFSPISIKDGSSAIYQNKVAAIVSGREALTMSMKQNARIRTVDLNLKVPRIISEVLNGVTVSKVADFATCKATVLVPVDWATAEAMNARALLANILLHATVALATDEAEFVW